MASVRNMFLPSPCICFCAQIHVSLKTMKNLFKLNSSGNVRPEKHVTMQNTVFRSQMTEKKDCHISSFFASVQKRTLQILLKASQHTSGIRNHYLYFTG